MIYLLHGPDIYRSRKKLKELVLSHRKKAGEGLQYERVDAEEDGKEKLVAALEAQSLFASKKLVVIEHALEPGFAEELVAVAPRLKGRNDLVLVLWEGGIAGEKKKALTKLASHADKVEEFPFLTGAKLSSWIDEEARARMISLNANERARLTMLGQDLWAVSNELEKLAVAPARATPASSGEEKNVFQLGDSFFSSRRAGLTTLLELDAAGHEEFGLFTYLANHARTVLSVKAYAERKVEVPEAHGIHPFVIKKVSALARPLSLASLRANLRRFFVEDHRIKTGVTRPREALIRMLIDTK